MFNFSITEYLLYGSIALGILAGLILAILNWINLSFIAGKITVVENEIDKKNIEFSNLKKERTAAGISSAAANKYLPSTPPATDADVPASPFTNNSSDNSEEIQVVRNVRAGVDEVASNHLEKEVINIDHQHSPAATPSKPAEQPVAAPLPEPAESSENDVMDIIDQDDLTGGLSDLVAIPNNGEIRIALFSNGKKDADFEAAWQLLRPQLLQISKPTVILDCSNIMFLYEKELGLLEKFRQIVSKYQGTLNLINCELDLKKSLIQLPQLARCVNQ